MKTWLFYIGVGVDIMGLCFAIYFILEDVFKGRHGTNNPIMAGLTLLVTALVVGAFLLMNAGKIGAANILGWIPGFPLAAYGLMILLFIILKPDMK